LIYKNPDSGAKGGAAAAAPPKKPFGQGEEFKLAVEDIQKFRNKYPSADAIPESEIPSTFDLSNVMGYDFTGKVRD
jgi:hypothetical protein